MICSSCYQPCDLANVVSWQRIGARVVTWVQCFGCYEAEEKRHAKESGSADSQTRQPGESR